MTTDSASLSSRISATETGGIFGVTAGTGISGGGTSGTVTVNVDFADATFGTNVSGSFSSPSSSIDTTIKSVSSSLSNRITVNEVASASISTRLTTEESNVDVLQSRVGQSLNPSDSPTFGGMTIQGTLTAQEYVVSSSVTTMSVQQASGSTIFGDSSDDTHQFTGSLSISGSLSTDLTGSFGVIKVGDGVFTSASLAAGGGGGGSTDYDGNRRILQTGFPTLFSASFNAGTSGSIGDFLDAVFFPNTAPSVSGSNVIVDEFTSSGSLIATITATDAEALSSDISFNTQSAYTDNFFKIHSGSGQVRTNTSTSASFNTTNRGDGELAHPFLIEVSDTITTSNATVFIRVTPNTAPDFRTTSTAGSVISNQTGSVNENTTDDTQILEFFLTDSEGDTISISPLSQSAANRFSLATANVSGGKRLRITTNTASFDFESISQHQLEVSASDEHFGNTSGSYLTTLPIVVNVTNNQAPTMAGQAFTLNESVGSRNDNGLGANTNALTTVGTITTNDNEGDTVTFTGLTLINGSGGGTYTPNPNVVAGLNPGESVRETFTYTIISNGKTASDIERILAFNELGIKDPIEYKTPWSDVLKHALNYEEKYNS